MHVTVNRVELDEDIFAGLVSLRLPTADELAVDGRRRASRSPQKRKARSRKAKAPKASLPASAGPARAAARAGPIPSPAERHRRPRR